MRTYLPDFFTPYPVNSLLDEFDRYFFGKPQGSKQAREFLKNDFMKTDIKEFDDRYELSIDLPGYKKEEVELALEKGYLTVSASKEENKEEKDDNGKLIRQERYAGKMSRNFYVGEEVTVEDIGAKFEDGVLKIGVPKKEKKEEIPQKQTVAIE